MHLFFVTLTLLCRLENRMHLGSTKFLSIIAMLYDIRRYANNCAKRHASTSFYTFVCILML